MKIRRPLAQLAGAQMDVLESAPSDLVRHAAMGGVLLTTAAVAGVSAAFAMNTAVGLPVVASLIVGVMWAFVIFNLDRMLIVSMVRMQGFWRNLGAAGPRLLLAVVIGVVISTPLVLTIFKPEIDSELQVMRSEQIVASGHQLDDRFARIPDLERQVDELQAAAAGQNRTSVSSDPEVRRLQSAFDTKEAEFREAEQGVICENDGTCGSGAIGRGPSYREKVEKRDRLATERDALRSDLNLAVAASQSRIEAGAKQEAGAAQTDLERVQGELVALRAERQGAEADVRRAEQSSDGLLARLEALERLSAGRPMMLLAHGALFLLFLLIELLPVAAKLMAISGPPTLYDKLLSRRENDTFDADDVWSDAIRDIADKRVAVRVRLEQDRADAQVEAGMRINALLVKAQSAIAERAVVVWAQVAATRSDAELAQWLRRHGASPPPEEPISPTVAMPTQQHETKYAPASVGFASMPSAQHNGAAATNGHAAP